MAGRGPVRKDPARRQRAASHKPASLAMVKPAHDVAATPEGVPSAPDGVGERTERQWLAYWSSPVAKLVDPVSDLPALERLFLLYDDCHQFRESIRKHPMLEGSQGQMVRNPFVKDLKDAQAEIRQLEDRFGLSPRARLGLNLTLGATAKTLADLNAEFTGGVDDDDPRFDVIDGEATERPA
jgi:P27 family predicted phage terminase small subunit